MNVRLFDRGEVHGAGKNATTCGITRLFARDWLPTEDPVNCRSCLRRVSERKAETTAPAEQLDLTA